MISHSDSLNNCLLLYFILLLILNQTTYSCCIYLLTIIFQVVTMMSCPLPLPLPLLPSALHADFAPVHIGIKVRTK